LLAIGHFMIGFSIILAVIILLRLKTAYGFLAAFGGGIWAMVPDVYWIDWFPDQYIPLARELHNSNWANLFFFHKIIDLSYLDDSPTDVVIPILIGFLITGVYCYIDGKNRGNQVKP